MAVTLVEARLWAWLHETFPERPDTYIRSDGRVQFFTFGPYPPAGDNRKDCR